MAINLTKILAWLIVIIGLAIIGWSVFLSYSFFTGQKDFPEVFKPSVEQAGQTKTVQNPVDLGAVKDQVSAQAAAQQQMQQTLSESLSKMIPADSIFKFSNMTAWIAFATFLVFAGGQMAGIGVKILIDRA